MAKPKHFSAKDRNYRQKLKEDPERYAAYLEKEKLRYYKRKASKKIKMVSEMTEREKRAKKKVWREAKRRSRKRTAETQDTLTPPLSPLHEPQAGEPGPVFRDRGYVKLGRKKVRRDRSKVYRDLAKTRQKLAEQERLTEKYKKKFYRAKLGSTSSATSSDTPDTPRTKTMKLLRGRNVSSKVKKTLIFHYCLAEEIKSRLKKRRQSNNLMKILRSSVMDKYKMVKKVKEHFGINKKEKPNKDRNRNCYAHLTREIREFLERDDSSRLSAGKKETITRNKIKKQKRYLSDSLQTLHTKFLSENTSASVSYSLFCRLRPFWILKPDLKQRETCICQIHDNLQFKANALKSKGVIQTNDIDTLVMSICCAGNNKICMYRECPVCKSTKVEIDFTEEEGRMFVRWNKWMKVSEERSKRNPDGTVKLYTAKFTVKREQESRISELTEEFHLGLERISRHIFNIRHQYLQIRDLKQNLGESNVLIHMDFSENFSCKYHTEVQSVHFGSSHNQATLHTLMVYLKDESIPICTISNSPRKDPAAIWSHLNPVIHYITNKYPDLKSIHFLSDGPSTQYKNKTNMAMFSTKVFEYGFTEGSWNYLETSHGKGAPDGIGSVIKRVADRLIAEKQDIPTAEALYNTIKDKTSVKLYFIHEKDMQEDEMYKSLSTVKGTLKIHQVITKSAGKILIRDISCFCQGLNCLCHIPKEITLVTKKGQINDNTEQSSRINISTDLIGKMCIVRYENDFYPGMVEDVDEDEVEVTAMSRIGINKYFWPTIIIDRLWYKEADVLALIPDVERVTGRHFKIQDDIFQKLSEEYDAFQRF